MYLQIQDKANKVDRIPPEALVKIPEITLPYYKGLNESITIFCSHTLFLLASGAKFGIRYKNGTERDLSKYLIN